MEGVERIYIYTYIYIYIYMYMSIANFNFEYRHFVIIGVIQDGEGKEEEGFVISKF